jgi:cytochrome c peroxidase
VLWVLDDVDDVVVPPVPPVPLVDSSEQASNLMFKVSILRNISKTAPYFHDGSETALDKAVAPMAEFQLSKQLGAADTQSMLAFLGALTADPLPLDVIKAPELPKSTAKTPKPADD